MEPYMYGTLEKIYFRLTLAGVKVAGFTLADADVILYTDGVIYSVDAGEIGLECSEVGNGWYQWQPVSVNQTQVKKMQIAITDTTGSSFDDNGLQIYTGGNSAAFLGTTP